MGGAPQAQFPGRIDELAIYREALPPERMKVHAARAGAMPELKAVAPGKSPVKTEALPLPPAVVKAEEFGEQEEMPSLARFRIAHGLGYLMPGMESIVPLAPSVDEGIKAVRKQGRLPIALRVQIGKSLDAVVEIREYREGVVAEKEFLPPTGYEEVKE